jgi:transposase
MKRKTSREFTEEFRREAVRLAEGGTKSLTQVARELGIHLETLRGWRRRYGTAVGSPPSVPAEGPLSLEEENRALRRENARLREEREILKKATAFFARDAR